MDSVRGQLLVAGPALLDPNFWRTVVLVVEHPEEALALGERARAIGAGPGVVFGASSLRGVRGQGREAHRLGGDLVARSPRRHDVTAPAGASAASASRSAA